MRPRSPNFVLDGRKVPFETGEMLLGAARRAGASIPTLCHVDGLTPYSTCRLCIVEVVSDRGTRVVTSCDYPVREDEKVLTTSARLDRLRRTIIALHLARAPGSPEIASMARQLGATDPPALRRPAADERCILCGLCVRVCSEVVGARALGFAGRGAGRRVTLPFEEDEPTGCIGCGACAAVCPTGCIEVEPLIIERLRQGTDRPCRYALMGLIPGAQCAQDYRCATCALDHEMFERASGRHPALLLLGVTP